MGIVRHVFQFEVTRMENTTTFSRGCRENCTEVQPTATDGAASAAEANSTVCCTHNLCNGDMEKLTSGADVMTTSSPMMGVVVMVMAAAGQKF